VITSTPITISVRPSLNTPRPIVEKISFKGYGPEKRNILFLAEGFTEDEKEKFRSVVRAIDKKMRNSPLHEPYKLLSNDYNTWMAFEPSTEGGLTIGPSLSWREDPTDQISYLSPVYRNERPVNPADLTLFQLVDLVGLPTTEQKNSTVFTLAVATALWTSLSIPGFNAALVSARVFSEWQDHLNVYKVTACNTNLGLISGRRLGDRYANSTNKDKPDNSWYRSQSSVGNFLYKDTRTLSSAKFIDDTTTFFNTTTHLQFLWTSEFFEYLNSLGESLPATAGFNIGSKWNLHGDDQGLVIIVTNLEYNAANYLNFPNIFGSVSIGQQLGINEPNLSGPKLLLNYTAPDIPVGAMFIEPIAATAIHELSHGINLGDEYDDFRELDNLTPAASSLVDVEAYHNLNTIDNIKLHGTKWQHRYLRVERSSALISDSVTGAAANTLSIQLFPGEGSKWKVNDQAVLITKNLNSEASFGQYQKNMSHRVEISGALTVHSKTGDNLIVSGPSLTGTTVFPKGSMFFFPKFHNGDILGIHLPGVLAFLNNGSGTFPAPPAGSGLLNIDLTKLFSSKNGACATSTITTMSATPVPIPHVNISASIKHRLLGMHEGAGGYNCGVVRTAAVCKMRSEYLTGRGHFMFCHLCKYIIVQEFNPSKHSNLESQYPGSPS
ncbi:MAG TPA: hypothetical protein VK498_02315, partial [Ferruginibacter sp.]|nr:hypothetical protein [Ferruginibacter sp.]